MNHVVTAAHLSFMSSENVRLCFNRGKHELLQKHEGLVFLDSLGQQVASLAWPLRTYRVEASGDAPGSVLTQAHYTCLEVLET